MAEEKKDQNLSTVIYEAIKGKIIQGEYTPGTLLMERSLADEFQVSRTPVREALKRLSQEGWLLWEERRRAVVSEIGESDVMELFTLREMIEPFAIRKIIAEGQPQVLAGLLVPITNDMEKLKDAPTEFMKRDMDFHSAIIEQLHLTKLMPLWAKINDDMMRLDVQTIYPKRDPDKIIAEHKKLIDAFWNGRLDAALEISAEHRLQILKVYLAKHKDKK